MGRMKRAWAVGLVLLLVAACGDGDSPDSSVGAESTTASTEAGDWCDTYRTLIADSEPTAAEAEAAADAAPEVIRDALQTLLSSDAPLTPAEGFALTAEIEAWAHETCGTDHPFCGGWIQYVGLIGEIALSGASEDEQREAYEQVEDVLEVVAGYAPAELAPQLDTITSTSTLTDEEERAAEAAYDELDAWADANC